MATAVPKTQPLAIDGTWTITSIGKRIRIEAGRAYAVDPWVHMFVLQIQPGMVVLEDLRSTAPGHYVGKDLPLMGQLKADLTPGGTLNVTVAGAFGPADYQLVPVQIDDQSWFARARSGQPPLPAAGVPAPVPAPVEPYPNYPPAAGQPVSPATGQAAQPAAAPSQFWAAGKYPGVIPPEPVEASEPGQAMLPEKAAPVRAGPSTSLGCGTLNDQLYLSLRNGGECWSCPHGYARNPAALVTSDHACAKRNSLGVGKFIQGPFRQATFVRTAYGCGAGLFRVDKECMKCPDGYKHQSVLGFADSCTRIASRDQILVQESKRIAPLMSDSIRQTNEIRSCLSKPDMVNRMVDALKRRDSAAAERVRDTCAPPAKLEALRRIPPAVLGGSGKDQKPRYYNTFSYSVGVSSMAGAGLGGTLGVSWDISHTHRGVRFFTGGELNVGVGVRRRYRSRPSRLVTVAGADEDGSAARRQCGVRGKIHCRRRFLPRLPAGRLRTGASVPENHAVRPFRWLYHHGRLRRRRRDRRGAQHLDPVLVANQAKPARRDGPASPRSSLKPDRNLISALNLKHNDTLPKWNYTIAPNL